MYIILYIYIYIYMSKCIYMYGHVCLQIFVYQHGDILMNIYFAYKKKRYQCMCAFGNIHIYINCQKILV